MKEFDALLEVADKLLGPGGCPWDHTQTFTSLQPYVLEEAHEVIEAVDHNDDQKIIEELGDLLYTVVFYAKLAEQQERFSMREILIAIKDKLIRRHPHIFSGLKVEAVDEIVQNWEKIKKQEKQGEKRESALDGIPATLPTLVKAQKTIKKMIRAKAPLLAELIDQTDAAEPLTEAGAGEALIALLVRSEQEEIDVESALRRTLAGYAERFRAWEKAT